MECKQCKKELEQATTKPKLFCSDRCRKAYNRGLLTPEKTDKVSEITDTITDKKENGQEKTDKHIDGTCYGCGEPQPYPLTEICYKCIARGATREIIGLPPTERQAWLNKCEQA